MSSFYDLSANCPWLSHFLEWDLQWPTLQNSPFSLVDRPMSYLLSTADMKVTQNFSFAWKFSLLLYLVSAADDTNVVKVIGDCRDGLVRWGRPGADVSGEVVEKWLTAGLLVRTGIAEGSWWARGDRKGSLWVSTVGEVMIWVWWRKSILTSMESGDGEKVMILGWSIVWTSDDNGLVGTGQAESQPLVPIALFSFPPPQLFNDALRLAVSYK